MCQTASDGKHHYDEIEKELVALYVLDLSSLINLPMNTKPPERTSFTQTRHEFRLALCDSFNTPEALDRLLELISRTNIYIQRGRAAVNVSVVELIANWVTKMLRIFGLGEGAVVPGAVGWGEVQRQGESSVDVRYGHTFTIVIR